MSDKRSLYEGMFLFNPADIGSSVATATELVEQVLERAEAETEAIFKWDERKLAYDIKLQKRGLYMLAYFRADGSKIVGMERDVNLAEKMSRCMILRADHIGDVELAAAKERQETTRTEAKLQSQEAAKAAEAAEAAEAAKAAKAAAAAAAPAEPAPAPAAEEAAPATEAEADATATTE
jgi:small subunit ribosomal protein S6